MKKHTWIECWNTLELDNGRGNKESTLSSYKSNLFSVIIPSFNELKKQHKNFTYIEDFGFKEYKIWYRYMKKLQKKIDNSETYSTNMLRRFYCVLSRLFDEAIKNGWIERNIVKLSDNFAYNKELLQNKKIRYQTLGEFNLFMTVVDEEFWQVFFSMLFWHGFRIGELLALQVKDINRENLKIHICHTVSYYTLDNTKYKLTSTKNYKDTWININVNCRNMFITYFDEFGVSIDI